MRNTINTLLPDVTGALFEVAVDRKHQLAWHILCQFEKPGRDARGSGVTSHVLHPLSRVELCLVGYTCGDITTLNSKGSTCSGVRWFLFGTSPCPPTTKINTFGR